MRAAQTDNVVMSPDGRTIAVGTWGDSLYLWSLAEGPRPKLHIPGFGGWGMAFRIGGDTVASAGGDAGLYLYDTRTGAPIRAFHTFPNALFGAWFTADGKAIVTVSH